MGSSRRALGATTAPAVPRGRIQLSKAVCGPLAAQSQGRKDSEEEEGTREES